MYGIGGQFYGTRHTCYNDAGDMQDNHMGFDDRFYFLISTQPPLLKRLSMHLQWGQEALSDRTRWWPVSSSQSPRLVFGARPDPVQV